MESGQKGKEPHTVENFRGLTHITLCFAKFSLIKMSCAYAMIIDIASLWSSFENAAGLMLSRHAVSVSIRTSMRILTMCLQTAILLRSIQRQDSKDAVPIH